MCNILKFHGIYNSREKKLITKQWKMWKLQFVCTIVNYTIATSFGYACTCLTTGLCRGCKIQRHPGPYSEKQSSDVFLVFLEVCLFFFRTECIVELESQGVNENYYTNIDWCRGQYCKNNAPKLCNVARGHVHRGWQSIFVIYITLFHHHVVAQKLQQQKTKKTIILNEYKS